MYVEYYGPGSKKLQVMIILEKCKLERANQGFIAI